MKGDDSILDIMPPRKKQNKGPNKKRKLKNLEEDREKELLSAKTSNKYKISQDLFSLFQSSKAIGRSDKKLEKRMRPMQLSKPGVLSDEPVKENDNSDSCMDEPTTPEIHIPTLHTDSHQLIHPNELDSKVMIISAEEVREEECSFMKLVLVQSKLILKVGLLELHSHVVLLSSPLPIGWLMSLVFTSVKKSVSKLGATKRLARTQL
ncbi:ATP-dependent RNA helicase DEAH13-like isoform X3 [Brassica napus]|uniref:ATP-dependent RNA helicase DEAH13-like isoform X3 n=1 Tax=Brassica napus TaxID=3708 RepID=UPI0020796129|nr:ATP-dependent RNA helicase DEAH13-like isoform X3 [Brassica napus]